MLTFTAEITGDMPLLQHRFGEAAEASSGSTTRRVHIDRGTPRDEAEAVSYRRPDTGALYHPSSAIARLLREAGGAHKAKGSRKSLKYIVPASIRLCDDTIDILRNGKPVKDFEVDSRPVTIPATKGRIMRHRPRIDTPWSMRFALKINDNLIDPAMVLKLLTEGGECIGIGDYRPERGGPFGVFQVTGWSQVK